MNISIYSQFGAKQIFKDKSCTNQGMCNFISMVLLWTANNRNRRIQILSQWRLIHTLFVRVFTAIGSSSCTISYIFGWVNQGLHRLSPLSEPQQHSPQYKIMLGSQMKFVFLWKILFFSIIDENQFWNVVI